MSASPAQRLKDWVEERRDELADYLLRLARIESPSGDSEALEEVMALLETGLESAGMCTRRVSRRSGAGHLFARPRNAPDDGPLQLLLGHCDTVWPVGTLATMPAELTSGVLRGPGVFDMKGGLTQIVFALRAIHELGLTPEVTPVAFINSDEETGSRDSMRYIRRLARRSNRVLVLEPAHGPSGKLKTRRKGGGSFPRFVSWARARTPDSTRERGRARSSSCLTSSRSCTLLMIPRGESA